MRSARLGETGIDAFIAGDVHVAEYTADFGCKCLALVGLQTMCEGGGQANVTIIERV